MDCNARCRVLLWSECFLVLHLQPRLGSLKVGRAQVVHPGFVRHHVRRLSPGVDLISDTFVFLVPHADSARTDVV